MVTSVQLICCNLQGYPASFDSSQGSNRSLAAGLELIAKLEHYLSREQYLLYVLRWVPAPVRLLPDLLGDTLGSWFPEFKF